VTLRFFYDIGSPYAWLAAERVDALMPVDLEWTPVLLGAIFRATDRSSWARTSRRGRGMAEIERRAAERGLPAVRWPDPWPNDGLPVMRAAAYAHRTGAGRRFAIEAFRAHFCEGAAKERPQSIELAASRSGLDPDAVLAATRDPAVKQQLRATTDAALAAGVFGVPSVEVHGTVYWGDDRLEEAAAAV
jgi:2-hydroxychromene-2-carboxylate isomerase